MLKRNIRFSKSLILRAVFKIIVDRGFLIPKFYEDPLYCLPPIFQILSHCALFVALLLWLNVWTSHIWCVILTNIIDLNLSNLGTWYCSVGSMDTQGPIGRHTRYKYLLTPLVMCTEQLLALNWINNLLMQKSTLQWPTMSLLFKDYSLAEVIYLLIRFQKTKSFLWNTKNSDKNGVNEQNTRTTHREKIS